MYRKILLALSPLPALLLVVGFNGCTAFSEAEAEAEAVESGVPEAASTDDGSVSADAPAGPDGAVVPDGQADADANVPPSPPECSAVAACASDKGCCLTPTGSRCTTTDGCDGFFIACRRDTDCAMTNEVCCFDDVQAAARCTAATACTGAKHRGCSTHSDCPQLQQGECMPVLCAAGTEKPVERFRLCVGPATSPIVRDGVTCMIP